MEDDIENMIDEFFESEHFRRECKKQFDGFNKNASGFLKKSELTTVIKNLVAKLPNEVRNSFDLTNENVDESMANAEISEDEKLQFKEVKNIAKSIMLGMMGIAWEDSN